MKLNEAKSLPSEYLLKNASVICSSEKTHIKADIHVKDSKIFKVAPKIEHDQAKSFDMSGYLISPGLINSHTHSAMGFFRDLGHGKAEMIENFLFPAEKSLTSELLKPLSYSYLFGALKSGTTFINDHYYMVDGVAEACEELGLRAGIGETIADLGGAFPSTATFKNAKDKIENWNYSKKIIPILAPHATDTVSDKEAECISIYASKNNIPIHMHLSQTKGELERTLKRTGKRPVEWADKQGLLSQNTLAVHLVSVDDSDISILEKSGCLGVVCPSSQIIYESLAPISKLKSSKMKLSVATDCAASNDAADLISEIKFSSLMDKEFGSSSIDHSYWFNSVTSHPAKALGLEDTIGKISDGMAADFVFYRQSLETLPISNLVPNLIFSQSSSNVEHVMIDGQFVLFNKNPLKISTSDMEEAFLEATKEIKKRCGL